MIEPPWLTKARTFIGFHEIADNQGIQEFINLAHTGELGDPWCAIFANACLESVGIKGTHSPAAASFTTSPDFVRQSSPQLGTICTFTRTGGNHVAFYTGTDKQGRLLVLGGNQSDQVCIDPHSTDTLTGYWWPKETIVSTTGSAPSSTFEKALAYVLKDEGGNDDDPRDPGGRTSRGILQREWDVWRQSHPGLPSDVWQAPQDQIEAIYRASYWDKLECDLLPAGVDYCVFDYGVNSGIGRSAKVLQEIVGVDKDGEIGPLTIAATAQANAAALIQAMCNERMAFLQGLKTWPTFGKGWTRRVEGVRTHASEMIGFHKPIDGDVISPVKIDSDLMLILSVMLQETDMDEATKALLRQALSSQTLDAATRAKLLQTLAPTPVPPVTPNLPALPGFDFNKLLPLIENPDVQKAIGSLVPILLPAIIALMSGKPLPPLPPPTPVPPPIVVPVTPPSTSGATVATSLSAGVAGAGASLLATVGGLLGPLTGPDASIWSQVLPIASVVVGAAFPAIAPIFNTVTSIFSTYQAGKKAAPK